MAYTLTYTLNSDRASYSVTGYSDITAGDAVVIPSIYNDMPVTGIGDEAFSHSSGLASITIPDSVRSIGRSAFEYCDKLTTVTIGNNVTSIGETAFHFCGSLASITIPDSVTSIGDSAFSSCTSLTSITIPRSVTDMGSAIFDFCNGLTSVTIQNGVTSISRSMFSGCSSLTSITIPDSVTSIGDTAFQFCMSLTNITIPNSIISIGNGAFEGCDSLQYNVKTPFEYLGNAANPYLVIIRVTDTTLANYTIDNTVKVIYGDVFSKCSNLTSIIIPNSVTHIGGSFSGCTSLTSVTIPNSVVSIGDDAFSGCTSLTNLTIPDSVTSIGEYAFNSCTNLTNILIPDSVVSIGPRSFYGCSNLTNATIGNSVTSIGILAFYRCSNLKQLILFPSTPPTLGSNAIPATIQTIYVQQSSKAAYQAATNWTKFASQIVSNNLYLSFVRFNGKNKEYIDNRDSLLADDIATEVASRNEAINALVGSGVQGEGDPPLQAYNKGSGTIEARLESTESAMNSFYSSYKSSFYPTNQYSNSIKISITWIPNANINTLFFVMIAIYDRSESKWLNCCMTIGEGKPTTGYFLAPDGGTVVNKTVSCTYADNAYSLTGPSDEVSSGFKYNLIRAAVLRID